MQVFSRGVHPNALLNSLKFDKGTRTLQCKQKCSLDFVLKCHYFEYSCCYISEIIEKMNNIRVKKIHFLKK